MYEYLGVLYRRTQTGEVAVEEDIRIGTADGRVLVEGIDIPTPPELHRRHYFLHTEEEEQSEGEVNYSSTFRGPLWYDSHDRYRAAGEGDNCDSGGDEEGEGEEEEESEEEHEEHEGPEDDSEADKEN